MQQLNLRQLGVRHVVSDGRNDLGEIGEAHLRAYCASLPGSYQAYSKSAVGMSRGSQQRGIITSSRGEARQEFAQAVQTLRNRLLSEDNTLTELAAHRLAVERIANADPDLLTAYCKDI